MLKHEISIHPPTPLEDLPHRRQPEVADGVTQLGDGPAWQVMQSSCDHFNATPACIHPSSSLHSKFPGFNWSSTDWAVLNGPMGKKGNCQMHLWTQTRLNWVTLTIEPWYLTKDLQRCLSRRKCMDLKCRCNKSRTACIHTLSWSRNGSTLQILRAGGWHRQCLQHSTYKWSAQHGTPRKRDLGPNRLARQDISMGRHRMRQTAQSDLPVYWAFYSMFRSP